jgi:hypothetical protein
MEATLSTSLRKFISLLNRATWVIKVLRNSQLSKHQQHPIFQRHNVSWSQPTTCVQKLPNLSSSDVPEGAAQVEFSASRKWAHMRPTTCVYKKKSSRTLSQTLSNLTGRSMTARPSVAVAQQYSSSKFVTILFHSSKGKIRCAMKKCCYKNLF